MTKPAKRIYLSPPHLTGRELEHIAEAIASNYVAPLGPSVDAFEHDLCAATGFAHAVALASGTAAIHVGLRGLGVGAGDLVIAATLTFIGSAAPATYLGAELVFIDCDAKTWTLDPHLLGEELARGKAAGRLPKAIVPTDLYGQSCDLDAIVAIAADYGVPVLCDAAESLGATYRGRAAGRGAVAAAYSFNGNKIITSSGGGMLASDDRDLIEHARFLSQQARDPAPHYQHSEIGYNYRMSNIVAALGRAQFAALGERVVRRREIFDFYREALGDLPGVSFMPEADYGRSNRWLTVIQIEPDAFGATREDVRLALEAENIESRPVWKPLHLQPVFSGVRTVGGKVAEALFDKGLCLPSGTAMTTSDLERTAGIIRRSAGRKP